MYEFLFLDQIMTISSFLHKEENEDDENDLIELLQVISFNVFFYQYNF